MDKPELRAAAPHQGGPLGSSGAAPAEKADEKVPVEAPASADKPADKPLHKPVAKAESKPAAPAAEKPATEPGGGAAAAEADKSDKPDVAADKAKTDQPAAAAAAVVPESRRLRRANPVVVARKAGRSTSEWAKRPSGRLVLPAVIALLLLGVAGTAGAYLVPQALQAAPSPSATPSFLDGTAAVPPASFPGLSTESAPGGPTGLPGFTTGPAQPVQNGARPADALAGWAQQIGTKVGIPVVAVQAYGYAELVLTRTMPSCHLSWTTIAAIASVESAHGSANGAVLGVDGSVSPPIYGLPLDGKGGRQLIADTDQGTLDGDTTFDRAVGPLQFIPATWNQYKVDADNNGVADPNDIDDASLTAATYLCQGGRDMSKAESWWAAILSYNAVQPYAQKVYEAANDYGRRSRG
ncbi:lytic transglycosylase domain-containing protein [Paractinoplanes durhamensis]|uniref:lytic transglycosylase domain-containing protein n=1 Tax=Paractinoplanes durhamensis TaxID=113563 RepID=UPI0019430B27|nr:lytic murein transglycosylase [Actinoplanes durhamensis]